MCEFVFSLCVLWSPFQQWPQSIAFFSSSSLSFSECIWLPASKFLPFLCFILYTLFDQKTETNCLSNQRSREEVVSCCWAVKATTLRGIDLSFSFIVDFTISICLGWLLLIEIRQLILWIKTKRKNRENGKKGTDETVCIIDKFSLAPFDVRLFHLEHLDHCTSLLRVRVVYHLFRQSARRLLNKNVSNLKKKRKV